MTMSETTAARKPRQRKKPARFCKLARQGDLTLLVIRQARPRSADLVDAYALEPIPSDFGRGLILHKDDGKSYCVNLSGPDTTCDCPGFESHGHCKHCESLLALQAAGKL
jgi:SWIM zinc finger